MSGPGPGRSPSPFLTRQLGREPDPGAPDAWTGREGWDPGLDGLFVPKLGNGAGCQGCGVSDLGSIVRRCPLACTAVGGDCYSFAYSVARESMARAVAYEVVGLRRRAGPSQLGCRVGLAGSDREFPRLLPDRARNGHALTSGSI